jgi:hypothetical protein
MNIIGARCGRRECHERGAARTLKRQALAFRLQDLILRCVASSGWRSFPFHHSSIHSAEPLCSASSCGERIEWQGGGRQTGKKRTSARELQQNNGADSSRAGPPTVPITRRARTPGKSCSTCRELKQAKRGSLSSVRYEITVSIGGAHERGRRTDAARLSNGSQARHCSRSIARNG